MALERVVDQLPWAQNRWTSRTLVATRNAEENTRKLQHCRALPAQKASEAAPVLEFYHQMPGLRPAVIFRINPEEQ
jgi:hypothetical protein